jgi:uncharacterized DUF497 family protein
VSDLTGVQNIVKIEFDLAKDRANGTRHGMSLRAAEGFDWDTALEREDDRFDYGEVRFVALGLIGDRLHVLVFTEGSHEDAMRAISLRPAEKHEVRFYHGQV